MAYNQTYITLKNFIDSFIANNDAVFNSGDIAIFGTDRIGEFQRLKAYYDSLSAGERAKFSTTDQNILDTDIFDTPKKYGSLSADAKRTLLMPLFRNALLGAQNAVDSHKFLGEKANSLQPLQFPRGNDTFVPTDVKKALYVEAEKRFIADFAGNPAREFVTIKDLGIGAFGNYSSAGSSRSYKVSQSSGYDFYYGADGSVGGGEDQSSSQAASVSIQSGSGENNTRVRSHKGSTAEDDFNLSSLFSITAYNILSAFFDTKKGNVKRVSIGGTTPSASSASGGASGSGVDGLVVTDSGLIILSRTDKTDLFAEIPNNTNLAITNQREETIDENSVRYYFIQPPDSDEPQKQDQFYSMTPREHEPSLSFKLDRTATPTFQRVVSGVTITQKTKLISAIYVEERKEFITLSAFRRRVYVNIYDASGHHISESVIPEFSQVLQPIATSNYEVMPVGQDNLTDAAQVQMLYDKNTGDLHVPAILIHKGLYLPDQETPYINFIHVLKREGNTYTDSEELYFLRTLLDPQKYNRAANYNSFLLSTDDDNNFYITDSTGRVYPYTLSSTPYTRPTSPAGFDNDKLRFYPDRLEWWLPDFFESIGKVDSGIFRGFTYDDDDPDTSRAQTTITTRDGHFNSYAINGDKLIAYSTNYTNGSTVISEQDFLPSSELVPKVLEEFQTDQISLRYFIYAREVAGDTISVTDVTNFPLKNAISAGEFRRAIGVSTAGAEIPDNVVTGDNISGSLADAVDGVLNKGDALFVSEDGMSIIAKEIDIEGGLTEIPDDSVTTPKLVDEAVTTPKLGDNAVTTPKIDDRAVTTQKIDNNAITTPKIAHNAVTADNLALDVKPPNLGREGEDFILRKERSDGTSYYALATTADAYGILNSGGGQSDNSTLHGDRIRNDTLGGEKLQSNSISRSKLDLALRTELDNLSPQTKWSEYFDYYVLGNGATLADAVRTNIFGAGAPALQNGATFVNGVFNMSADTNGQSRVVIPSAVSDVMIAAPFYIAGSMVKLNANADYEYIFYNNSNFLYTGTSTQGGEIRLYRGSAEVEITDSRVTAGVEFGVSWSVFDGAGTRDEAWENGTELTGFGSSGNNNPLGTFYFGGGSSTLTDLDGEQRQLVLLAPNAAYDELSDDDKEKYRKEAGVWASRNDANKEIGDDAGSVVIPKFVELPDTPGSYTSNGGKILAVNASENAVEFIDAPTQSTPTDLSNYYTKSQIDSSQNAQNNVINGKENIGVAYTKAQSDGRYYTKTTSDGRYYQRSAIDTKNNSQDADINDRALARDVYTKSQSDIRYYTKTASDDRYYTKTESDNSFYTKTESDGRYYGKNEVYTKSETDNVVSTAIANLGSGGGDTGGGVQHDFIHYDLSSQSTTILRQGDSRTITFDPNGGWLYFVVRYAKDNTMGWFQSHPIRISNLRTGTSSGPQTSFGGGGTDAPIGKTNISAGGNQISVRNDSSRTGARFYVDGITLYK